MIDLSFEFDRFGETLLSFHMALAAHNRSFFLLQMTPFAVGVKSFGESRFVVRGIFRVAFRTLLIFRGLIF
jgi:hypothetical protein